MAWDKARLDELTRLYADPELKFDDIAERMQTSRGAIAGACARLGLNRRPRVLSRWNEAMRTRLASLCAGVERPDFRAIGLALGCSYSSAYDAAHRYGFAEPRAAGQPRDRDNAGAMTLRIHNRFTGGWNPGAVLPTPKPAADLAMARANAAACGSALRAFETRSAGECVWPIEADDGAMLACCAPACRRREGGPEYCDDHHALARSATQPKKLDTRKLARVFRGST